MSLFDLRSDGKDIRRKRSREFISRSDNAVDQHTRHAGFFFIDHAGDPGLPDRRIKLGCRFDRHTELLRCSAVVFYGRRLCLTREAVPDRYLVSPGFQKSCGNIRIAAVHALAGKEMDRSSQCFCHDSTCIGDCQSRMLHQDRYRHLIVTRCGFVDQPLLFPRERHAHTAHRLDRLLRRWWIQYAFLRPKWAFIFSHSSYPLSPVFHCAPEAKPETPLTSFIVSFHFRYGRVLLR